MYTKRARANNKNQDKRVAMGIKGGAGNLSKLSAENLYAIRNTLPNSWKKTGLTAELELPSGQVIEFPTAEGAEYIASLPKEHQQYYRELATNATHRIRAAIASVPLPIPNGGLGRNKLDSTENGTIEFPHTKEQCRTLQDLAQSNNLLVRSMKITGLTSEIAVAKRNLGLASCTSQPIVGQRFAPYIQPVALLLNARTVKIIGCYDRDGMTMMCPLMPGGGYAVDHWRPTPAPKPYSMNKMEARQAADVDYNEIVVNYKLRDIVGLLISSNGELDELPFLLHSVMQELEEGVRFKIVPSSVLSMPWVVNVSGGRYNGQLPWRPKLLKSVNGMSINFVELT